jgi:hypothetical protein
MTEALEMGAYVRKGATSRVIVASRLKISFLPDGSTSPGNYGCLFVTIFPKTIENCLLKSTAN